MTAVRIPFLSAALHEDAAAVRAAVDAHHPVTGGEQRVLLEDPRLQRGAVARDKEDGGSGALVGDAQPDAVAGRWRWPPAWW